MAEPEVILNGEAIGSAYRYALHIPQCIQHYGADSYPCEQGFVPEEVFLARLPEIAKNAIMDACTGSNPRIPTQEEMEKLLKCCYYDMEVDFDIRII